MTGTHQPPLSHAVRKVAGCFLGSEEQVAGLSPLPQDSKHSLAGVSLLCSTVGLLLDPPLCEFLYRQGEGPGPFWGLSLGIDTVAQLIMRLSVQLSGKTAVHITNQLKFPHFFEG